MANETPKKKKQVPSQVTETSENAATSNETEVSTSNPAPKPEKAASSTKKNTKNETVNVSSKKQLTKCKNCEYKDTGKKLEKHLKYFCDKNDKWWGIEISEQFQHRTDILLISGNFVKVLFRYKLESDIFTFEIFTDIPCHELGKYETIVHLKALKKRASKLTIEAEIEAEHDWQLTKPDWEKKGYGNKFEVKVKICLKPEDQSNTAEVNKTITFNDNSTDECNSEIDLK